MLLRKPIRKVRRKITVELTADMAERLDRLTSDAKAAGLEAPVEEAIVSYLTRAIGHAESQLLKQKT
jgi:hypothetical protein